MCWQAATGELIMCEGVAFMSCDCLKVFPHMLLAATGRPIRKSAC